MTTVAFSNAPLSDSVFTSALIPSTTNHRWLAVLVGLCFMMGCEQTPSNYKDAQHQAQQRLVHAYNQVSRPDHTPVIEFVQGYFVPVLEQLEPVSTSWGAQWVDFNFNQHGIWDGLSELLRPYNVSVRLLDDIDRSQPITFDFQGEVQTALRQLSLLTGLHVEISERVVTLRRFEMAEFDVAFLAGATNFFLGEDIRESRNQNTNSMVGTVINNESPQYLNFTSESLSVWNDLEAAIELLLSGDGSVVINQSSTSVLVRDYPQHVEQIRAYLVQQNRRLTRQVAVDVQVIDVTFNDSKQAGIDWNLVYQAASAGNVVNFTSGLTQMVQPGGVGQQLEVMRQGGRFDGSQAIIRALAEQGVVEVSSHPRVVSLNNQIAKIVLEDNSTYLASAGSNATANVGSSDLLIPGVVTTGFELYVLPKVTSSQVVMQLSTSLSDLVAIDQVSSGDNTIQTPHTNRKKFFMKAMVADGETLLISGLKSSKRQWREERGFVSWLFGGQRHSHNQHSETVLLLTPHILPTASVL